MDIVSVIVKSIVGSLTEEERIYLNEWLETPGNERLYKRLCDFKTFNNYKSIRLALEQDKENVWKDLKEQIQKSEQPLPYKFKIRSWQISAAAVILFLGLLMTYVYKDSIFSLSTDNTIGLTSRMEPGSERALLVLSDGKVIDLESKSGNQIEVENAHNVSNEQGVLNYLDMFADQDLDRHFAWHEIKVPISGRYQVILQDGTKVWLNSTTKLRYPTCFLEDTREVFLDGEAFFEVAKDVKKPFIVHTKGEHASIVVLGTSFNVKAYHDEKNVVTTLVEGRVQVKMKKDKRVIELLPDQQFVLEKDGNYHGVDEVNVWKYTAWKEGIFIFDDEPLGSIMKRLSRWYNFKLIIENKQISDRRFTGAAYFNEPLHHIIDHINKTTEIQIKVDKDTLYLR